MVIVGVRQPRLTPGAGTINHVTLSNHAALRVCQTRTSHFFSHSSPAILVSELFLG